MPTLPSRRLLLVAALWWCGCEGQLVGPRPDAASSPPTDRLGMPAVEEDTPMSVGLDHASLGLRRLTREEYGNTIEDLFGVAGAQEGLVEDVPRARFTNNVHGLNVSQSGVSAYSAVAETVAAQAASTLTLPVGCTLDTLSDDCFAQVLPGLLRRVFRRAATSEDTSRFSALWMALRADFSQRDSLEAVLTALLQSPSFLYRREVGERLDAWELASRLSYLLWASTPDEALLAAAADGTLGTPAGRAAQFDRMWQAPRARVALRRFAAQWLGLDHARVSRKDAAVLAGAPATLQADLEQEFKLLFEKTLFADEGSLAAFLAGKRTWVNAPLAGHYGLPAPDAGTTTSTTWRQCAVEHERCDFTGTRAVRYGTVSASVSRTLTDGTACDNAVFGDPAPTLLKYCWVEETLSVPGDGFVELSLEGTPRRGALTTGLVLAAHAKESGLSTPQLGKFLRANVLCQDIPAPPANVALALPANTPADWTYRQRFEAYTTSSPQCAGCHKFINSPGYAWQPFDPLGRFSAIDERGRAYETAGDFPFLDGKTVNITSIADLAERVSGSRRATACFTRMGMEYALGRTLAAVDLVTLDELTAQVPAGSTSLRLVLRTFVISDAFLARGPLE